MALVEDALASAVLALALERGLDSLHLLGVGGFVGKDCVRHYALRLAAVGDVASFFRLGALEHLDEVLLCLG